MIQGVKKFSAELAVREHDSNSNSTTVVDKLRLVIERFVGYMEYMEVPMPDMNCGPALQ
jgi:hypothetical protein